MVVNLPQYIGPLASKALSETMLLIIKILTFTVCRATNIEVQLEVVNVAKREHLTPEYRKVNPLGKIPCYAEPGFSLGESAAILRYLAAANSVPDHWYPGLSLSAIVSGPKASALAVSF